MVLRMLEGLIGFVVVHRPVVLVVVLDTPVVLKLVLELGLVLKRRRSGSMRPAALHGVTIQGQAKQQEDVDDPAHKNDQVNFTGL